MDCDGGGGDEMPSKSFESANAAQPHRGRSPPPTMVRSLCSPAAVLAAAVAVAIVVVVVVVVGAVDVSVGVVVCWCM